MAVSIQKMRHIVGLLGISVASYVFLSTEISWTAPRTATVIYSVLVYLCVTMTVAGINRMWTDPSLAHRFFTGGTGYASIIFAGAAVFYVFNDQVEAIHAITSGIFLNLVAFATTGLSMLGYAYFAKRSLLEQQRWNTIHVPVGIIGVGTVIFVICMYIARQPLDTLLFLIMGYIVGGVAVISYLTAALLVWRHGRTHATHDPHRIALSFLLLACSSLIHVSILPMPNRLWVVSVTFMAAAFIVAIVGTVYPFLRDIGVNDTIAYVTAISSSAVVILPLLVAHVITSRLFGILSINVPVTTLIHIGGAVLAMTMAYTVSHRARQGHASYNIPLTALFLLWMMTELIVALWRFLPGQEMQYESLNPYGWATLGSLLLLAIDVKRTLTPSSGKGGQRHWIFYVAVIGIFLISLLVSGLAEVSLASQFSASYTRALSVALLLSLSYLTLFMLLTLVLLLTGRSGGKFGVEELVIAAFSMWLVIVILKANFVTWSAGWWAAEGLLAAGIVLFPSLLIYLISKEVDRSIELTRHATIVPELVSQVVGTCFESAIDSLDTLSKRATIADSELALLARALSSISCANDLTRYMGYLITSDRLPPEVLEPTDMGGALEMAILRLREMRYLTGIEIEMHKERTEHLVMANALLTEAFIFLISVILNRLTTVKAIRTEIRAQSMDHTSYWNTRLYIQASPEVTLPTGELLERYMERQCTGASEFVFASRLISLFRGHTHISVNVDQGLQVILEVLLPTTEE